MDCLMLRQQTYFNMHNLHRVRHLLHEEQMLRGCWGGLIF